MSKYYLITLKNARTYEARNVRVNGLPLAGLHALVAPGRLECLVLPAAPSGGLGGFKSLGGIFTEFDVVDPAVPDRRWTLRGRVRSATRQPGRRSASESAHRDDHYPLGGDQVAELSAAF